MYQSSTGSGYDIKLPRYQVMLPIHIRKDASQLQIVNYLRIAPFTFILLSSEGCQKKYLKFRWHVPTFLFHLK